MFISIFNIDEVVKKKLKKEIRIVINLLIFFILKKKSNLNLISSKLNKIYNINFMLGLICRNF